MGKVVKKVVYLDEEQNDKQEALPVAKLEVDIIGLVPNHVANAINKLVRENYDRLKNDINNLLN